MANNPLTRKFSRTGCLKILKTSRRNALEQKLMTHRYSDSLRKKNYIKSSTVSKSSYQQPVINLDQDGDGLG